MYENGSENLEGGDHLGNICLQEYNIKMKLDEVTYNGGDCIHLAQDTRIQRDVVNMIL
jgi:hypothetical protein